MDLKKFLNFISRHWAILIFIPLVAVIVTYLIVRTLPDNYKSHARIATGLVERPDAIVTGNGLSESQVNQQFDNIIQVALLKKILTQVSYQLIIHDLTNSSPFHKQSKLVSQLSAAEKNNAVEAFRAKYNSMEDLSLTDKSENNLYRLLVSMNYNYETLLKNLTVYRLGNSDFIEMQFDSDNPKLSAYTLNTLCKEFITYYTNNELENNRKAVKFLDSLLQQKQLTMRQKMEALKNFKINHGILDVNDQATTLISQIADFETKRQEAVKNIGAYTGVLQNIDKKFDPADRKYFESTLTDLNQEMAGTRDRLRVLNDEYVRSNFDPKYKTGIDSLQKSLKDKINQSNDKYAYSPLTTKQDLVTQKLQYELNLELAKNSVSALDNQLAKLNGRLHSLVPSQATIQTIQDNIALDSKEYIELSKKFNETSLESNFPVKLRQVEMAMPGAAQPSKKWMLVLFSGFVSLALCFVVLFALFYFDNSIQDANQLANTTRLPVIGSLNILSAGSLDLRQLWEKSNQTKELKDFKDQMRSIRFEIEKDLNNSRVLSITSLNPDAGKTFFILNLAFSYLIANKKVLLIDGNFEEPGISQIIEPDFFLEDYFLSNYNDLSVKDLAENLLVLGNRGTDKSLVEISSYNTIREKFQSLKDQFDIVLIETPSLDAHNKAKEWIMVSEKLVPVFEAGQSINEKSKQGIEYLNSLDGKVIGWVLNKVKTKTNRSVKTRTIQKIKRIEA